MRVPSFALIMAAAAGVVATPSVIMPETERTVERRNDAIRRYYRKALAGVDTGYRSKNAPTKRKLKANRLHISRRTKRKHRRARA